MNLDANDLILFARVMESGSFSKAAERTGLPKSTLSRRITALEASLGERLLTRSTRQLVITDFGERMLEHANRLLEENEAAGAMAQHRQAAPRGLLRVSLPADVAVLKLSGLIKRFVDTYPDVRLEFDLSPRQVDLLAERFDLALRVATRLPDDATMVARAIGHLQYRLYASPAYLASEGTPSAPDDLLKHRALRAGGGGSEAIAWRLTRGKEKWEGLPGAAVAANSPGFQRDLALSGMGIVGLPDRMAANSVAEGLLVPVLPDWQLPTSTLWCVTPGRRLLPTRTTAFIDMLREALAEQPR